MNRWDGYTPFRLWESLNEDDRIRFFNRIEVSDGDVCWRWQFGVSMSTISLIDRRVRWAHV